MALVQTPPTPAPIAVDVAPKKVKSPKKAVAKKAKTTATHPAWADMIVASVKALGEKGGSSCSAIKKHMVSAYKIDGEKAGPFMKRGIKAAMAGGQLVQAKGHGMAGSFKLGSGEKKAKASKTKKVVKKAATGDKKKAASPKKATKKAKVAASTTSPAAAPKPTKAKKAKSPAKKSVKKAAKPKKAKSASPKKAKVAKKAGAAPKPKTMAKKAKSPKPKAAKK